MQTFKFHTRQSGALTSTTVSDKLDLPRLEADIPKFLQNSRAFEEEDKLWWARFFESRNQFYAPKEKPSTWLLDELIAIKARQQEEMQGEEAPNVGQAEAVGAPTAKKMNLSFY